MAELACLTGRAGGAKEVLPALEYLAHPLTTLPLEPASLPAAAAKELVVVDATRDLSRAQALCRSLRGNAEHLAILVVMPEVGLAGLQRDWGASDFVLPGAGPAEVEARLRLLLTQRPAAADPDAAIRVGELVVDPVSYQVRLRARPLDLTYKEFELLRFLAARPGSPSMTSWGTRTPWRVSWSWAAVIPLARASVAATSMVENRPLARWGRNGKSRTCTTGRRPRSYSRCTASVTRSSKTRAAAKSATAPSRTRTTTAISSLRMRPDSLPAGERRQQGQLGAVGDRRGPVVPALAVDQHAGVREHGGEPVTEPVAEAGQDAVERAGRDLHLWHPGGLPQGGEQSDPDHAAMVGCAAVPTRAAGIPASEEIGWPSSPA